MKNILLPIFFFVLTINLNAQSMSDDDWINKKDFSILKTDSTLISVLKTRLSGLKTIKEAEPLFGSNYDTTRSYSMLFGEHFTRVKYSDGLKLNFSDESKSLFTFEITSNKYTMLLANGQQIRVGMKGDELSAIFPKSFSKRKTNVERKDWYGKVTFNVYFSFVRDNKVYLEGACIVFVLNKENGVLEQIISWEPG